MTFEQQTFGTCTLICDDALAVLPTVAEASVDVIVTDPPYGLEFMGKEWDKLARPKPGHLGRFADGNKPSFERVKKHLPAMQEWHYAWAVEALRILKPGGHLLAFGGTRTHHRLMCALEDAGFEIRDTLMWVYGSGFPKSLDVSKAMDKAAGVEREVIGQTVHPDGKPRSIVPRDNGIHAGGQRLNGVGLPRTGPATDAAKQWDGWGTALKPAWEPIILARKPLAGTVAENVLRWGTGALNIDGCRILTGDDTTTRHSSSSSSFMTGMIGAVQPKQEPYVTGGTQGRWPANVVHDGGEEVLETFPQANSTRANGNPHNPVHRDIPSQLMSWGGVRETHDFRDTGSAGRFFYTAKVAPSERDGSTHPTMKPIALMRWLVRLVTPPGGLVCDPFLGSGTTAVACHEEGLRCLGIERELEYYAIAHRRIDEATRQGNLFYQAGGVNG